MSPVPGWATSWRAARSEVSRGLPRSVQFRLEIGRNPRRDRFRFSEWLVLEMVCALVVFGMRVRGGSGVAHRSAAHGVRNRRIMRKRYSDGGWIVLPVCKPSATAPPGGRPGLWRVAEHARSGARVDVMMSGPAAERSNGSGPSQSNAAIARRLTQEISITPTKPEATPPESPHPRRPNCLRCSDTPHSRCGTGPISMRSTTDLEAEADRSRRGVRPISTRSTTDLEPEPDRSRRGLARGAGCGRAPASISSEASREPVRRRPRRSSGRAGRCPYAAPPCGRPRRSHQ